MERTVMLAHCLAYNDVPGRAITIRELGITFPRSFFCFIFSFYFFKCSALIAHVLTLILWSTSRKSDD